MGLVPSSNFDPEVPITDTLGAMAELVRKGKVERSVCDEWFALIGDVFNAALIISPRRSGFTGNWCRMRYPHPNTFSQ